ncbi:MAG: hypothetical protein DRJ67_10785 [Thermoprotei archaeon]|nr:MAG: hypothetical protein DRJ67_10785 [Thermoprotei archaeon]
MEEYSLVTPGHAPPMDTLIALGIVAAVLDACPEANVSVWREGSRYRIRLKGHIDRGGLLECVLNTLRFEAEYAAMTGEGKFAYARMPQPAMRVELLREIADDLELEGTDPLIAYSRPEHALTRGEGRAGKSRSKRLRVAHVQIAPWAGKYITSAKEGEGTYFYAETEYVACPLCLALAWMGLLKATAVIAARHKKSIRVFYVAPDPIRMNMPDLALLLLVFGEKYELIPCEGPPLLAAPLLPLASGETLHPLKGGCRITVWEHARTGQFIGIRGLASLPLRPLLEFIAKAKSEGRYLPALVEDLRFSDPSLLAEIVECLVFGEPDPYSVVRDLWSQLSRDKRRERLRWLEQGMVDALFKVWARRHGASGGHGARTPRHTPYSVAGLGS